MAKDGCSKAKSAEDHASARKAAQLRKQRGHGGAKKQAQVAPSLSDIIREQRRHQQLVQTTQRFVEGKTAKAIETLEKAGVVVLSRDDRDNKEVIRNLKNKFRSTDVRWDDDGEKCVFARQKKVA